MRTLTSRFGESAGEQINSEIHHSLQAPACFGVPHLGLQKEEMPVNEWGRLRSRQKPSISAPGQSLELGVSILKQLFFK